MVQALWIIPKAPAGFRELCQMTKVHFCFLWKDGQLRHNLLTIPPEPEKGSTMAKALFGFCHRATSRRGRKTGQSGHCGTVYRVLWSLQSWDRTMSHDLMSLLYNGWKSKSHLKLSFSSRVIIDNMIKKNKNHNHQQEKMVSGIHCGEKNHCLRRETVQLLSILWYLVHFLTWGMHFFLQLQYVSSLHRIQYLVPLDDWPQTRVG